MIHIVNSTRDIPRGNISARTAAANEFWGNIQILKVERDLGIRKTKSSNDLDFIVFAEDMEG
jgi:hypothetical protein